MMKRFATWVALGLLSVPAPATQLLCETYEEPCSQGACQGVEGSWFVNNPGSGGNVTIALTVCGGSGGDCHLTGPEAVGPSQGKRFTGTGYSGSGTTCCNITISPKQGLSWGDVNSCDDIAHECQEVQC